MILDAVFKEEGELVADFGNVYTHGEATIVDQEYNPQSANAQSGKAVAEAIGKNNIEIDNAINNGDAYAINTAKGYTDEKVGNIETALDSIIAIQNSLIGGDA